MITEREVLEGLLANRECVRENADTLRQQYGSDCLAINKGVVVDHDADQIKLMERTLGSDRGMVYGTIVYGTIDHLTGLPELVTVAKERLKELTVA